MTTDPTGELAALRVEFQSFVAREGKDYSPLYERLSAIAADEPDVLRLLLPAPPEFRRYTLFFASLHSVLAENPDDPLAAWFPTVSGRPPRADDPAEAFTAFCRRHAGAIAERVAVNRTQTNEVGRSAALLLGLARAAARAGDAPLGLIELGCSAGLNLGADRFGYAYENGPVLEAPDSDVVIRSRLEGDWTGLLPAARPAVAWRAGLDAAPIDVTDDRAVGWLAACVFGDHAERAVRLRAAVAAARKDPPRLLRRTLPDGVAELLAEVPDGVYPCLMNSWVLSYVDPGAVARVLEAVREYSRLRPVSWVTLEPSGSVPGFGVPIPAGAQPPTLLGVSHFAGGERTDEFLAVTHPHGAWIRRRSPDHDPA
ncbi:DUF2332 domain-containing protein [Actinomadura macrotermitis]|uniref:DUF2332 domain-containing protein n=1 Tax=Actinomadura macrotermitis TaxID=2585200 RepID=A0A7K0BRG2_9ACTN|nr:DUF2332 domain-containing protein [Actinomadura macrotermitis]MQY03741.1 hypothetical protein [Actinomadura macrotermitis]